MKRMIVWLLVLVFALAGCQSAASGNTDPNTLGSAPTQTQDTAPTVPSTVKPTEPTVLPTEPTVQPYQNLIVDDSELEAYTAYSAEPTDYLVHTHNLGAYYAGWEYDRTDMVSGYLYSVNKDGNVYLITDQQVRCFDVTSEHIYFVTYSDLKTVYRTDLQGENRTAVYQSKSGTVSRVEFFGKDENGVLLVAENENRIVSYDLATKATELLMESYRIGRFSYMPDYQSPYSETSAPVIQWEGQRFDGDRNSFRQMYLISEQQPMYSSNSFPFIWKGEVSISLENASGLDKCVIGHLYFYDKDADMIYTLLSEEVSFVAHTEAHISYVKKAEPNRIYTLKTIDLTKHSLAYESDSTITYLDHTGTSVLSNKGLNDAVVFIEDNQRAYLLDLVAKEVELLLEQPYIKEAWFVDGFGSVDSWDGYNQIVFEGRTSDNGPIEEYRYYRDTGEIDLWPY